MKPNKKKLAILLTRFFTDRLISQQNVSPNTVAAYRDTFRLLLRYVNKHLKKEPSNLIIDDIDAPLIIGFLDDLEMRRKISARSRNLRLTAVRTFFRYLAYELPEHSEQIQRVLAIPTKRFTLTQINYLERSEVDALLSAPNLNTWLGRRDHALILFAVQTGLRVSEITSLRTNDISLTGDAHVNVIGKGRKERCTPLTKVLKKSLKSWMSEPIRGDSHFLFPNRIGGRLSTDGIQYLLTKHTKIASQRCPSLKRKRVSPHVLRHTSAMTLLQSGVDTSLIALWLGHKSPDTTQIYLQADMTMKREIMSRTTPHGERPFLYKPDDMLLDFLNSL